MSKKIKTRFAPSPTGFLHVGGLRTALYAYLIARQNKGDFILRIEDTDQTRSVEGAVENLLKSLTWAGLKPDEGVLLDSEGKVAEKGDFGPYTQSHRLDIYKKYAQELLDKGLAYKCFCSSERLTELREKQQAMKKPTRYDGACRELSVDDIKKKEEAGEKHVIRMKVPENRDIEFEDKVRGKVRINTHEVDDQVIIKSDGFPTYHFASVIDDQLMGIDYVIRGEEWLPSTPKHILLYEFFGWDVPEFAHLSLLLNPDKTKLSKRQGHVAVGDYKKEGYLPEALLNFVALLGWNPGTEQEIFSLDELVKVFDMKHIHKAGAVFDIEKLNWMNGEYIKKLDFEKYRELALPFLKQNFPDVPKDKIDGILKLEQGRIDKFDEIGKAVEFILQDKLEYDSEMLVWKKSDKETAIKSLELLITELEAYKEGDWTTEKLEEDIKKFIEGNGLKNGDVLWPMRVALTGQEKSPTPFEVAGALGKEKSVERLTIALELLR